MRVGADHELAVYFVARRFSNLRHRVCSYVQRHFSLLWKDLQAELMVVSVPAVDSKQLLSRGKNAVAAAISKKLSAGDRPTIIRPLGVQVLEEAINHGRTAAVTAPGSVQMQGGVPLVLDGQVVGAIGVSADTPAHDQQIAEAGAAALGKGR